MRLVYKYCFSLLRVFLFVLLTFNGGRVSASGSGLPKLLDLGAKKCIPCKMMMPVMDALEKEYAGRLNVEFIDVWLPENQSAATKYKIKLIPTQIFLDGSGKELWRHVGYFSKEDILAKWKELGYDLDKKKDAFSRLQPAVKDTRPKDKICYMCDGTINPRTEVSVETEKGKVRLCSIHCYFIMYSSLVKGRDEIEKNVRVTDWNTGKSLRGSALSTVYLRGLDSKGRPTIRAYSNREAALADRKKTGGNIIGWNVLKQKELACRCGFCDRAVYPEDSALVKAGGVYTWGCCPLCALGVAARLGKDIEVHQKDALTGDMIVVKTMNGSIASLEPETAVAWFGMRKKPGGSYGSAGCFHQAFFTNEVNLKKWVDQHPLETGKMITIQKALAAKMKLTSQQILKACKIGECVPK